MQQRLAVSGQPLRAAVPLAAGWFLIACLVFDPSNARADQPSNGLVTLIQDTFSATGGQVSASTGGVVFSFDQPIGGDGLNSLTIVNGGYPAQLPTWPPGTRTISVSGTVDNPQATVVVNGVKAVVNGTIFVAEGVVITEGPNLLTATATDLAGNEDAYSMTVYLDTQPPLMPTLGGYPQVTLLSQYTLSGTKTPDTSIWINGVEVVPLNDETNWLATLNLVEGDNLFVIVAKDAVGNPSATLIINIIADNLPPMLSDITYTDPSDVPFVVDPGTGFPKTNFSPVTIRGQVDDSLTVVDINGLIAEHSGRDFEVEVPLALGQNDLQLIATSPNQHVTQDSLEVIRGTIPVIQAIEPPQGSKLSVGIQSTIEATATDAEQDLLEYQFLLGGDILRDWTSRNSTPWMPTADPLGIRTLEVRTRDAYGGYGSAQVHVYLMRQPVAPP